MGQDETAQVVRVRTHMLSLNATHYTSDMRIYIPTNKSKLSLFGHNVRHRYVMTLILILSL